VPGELLCKDVNGLHSLEANNCLSAGISPTFVFVRDWTNTFDESGYFWVAWCHSTSNVSEMVLVCVLIQTELTGEQTWLVDVLEVSTTPYPLLRSMK